MQPTSPVPVNMRVTVRNDAQCSAEWRVLWQRLLAPPAEAAPPPKEKAARPADTGQSGKRNNITTAIVAHEEEARNG